MEKAEERRIPKQGTDKKSEAETLLRISNGESRGGEGGGKTVPRRVSPFP